MSDNVITFPTAKDTEEKQEQAPSPEELVEKIKSIDRGRFEKLNYLDSKSLDTDTKFGAVKHSLTNINSFLDILLGDIHNLSGTLEQLIALSTSTDALTQSLISALVKKGIITKEQVKEAWDELLKEVEQQQPKS